ncbi:hypothetical protein IW140_003861 [Coemansia sp. RSA 1813]|nr:hypothetical protein EV178_004096 [Coemansia sp. RSA 1646]KAJ1770698.1 hypothetical protein LPJ74_002988 [Coemansia sp. RSA 1843]KAJ2087348.1 hypothetical protein IW138_005054 [Coemansia sp. RSA 986]KAJ2215688.1 hypothetical protein EV179_001912 [Coemansia sp. RSA 487]KAJ2568433.1 hypothetical protein IW140_003861 [Coemansia sp. RSA 1813]
MTLGTQLARRTLAGKTAVVVGASGGIGGAIAQELAVRGARLLLAGRNASRLETLRTQLVTNNDSMADPGHMVVPFDIRDPQSIGDLARIGKDITTQGIDVLVNSAGISRNALLVQAKRKDVVDLMDTNLVGVMDTCKAFVPQMLRNRGASIINVSSIIGLHGNAGQSVYAATKAGLVGFTKSLAKEVASRGVCANVVAPGFICTEMTSDLLENNKVTKQLVDRIPLQAPGSVEDVAHAVAFLAEARYITGQVLVVDGGLFI